jgi:DNA-binding NarL/FixJ family response regulator
MSERQVVQRRSKVLIVDDHAVVRQGLAELINCEMDLVACGEADNPKSAMAAIEELSPDVAVVDITLKGGDGIELCHQICSRWPTLPILVLSMHDESLYAERALNAGALGYVMKQEPQETVMAAIRQVLKGDVYLSQKIASKILRSLSGAQTSADAPPLERLSDRELQVFRMVGEGRTVKDMAEGLFLSPKTIETHKEHIKRKLHLQSSSDLRRYAIGSRMNEKH